MFEKMREFGEEIELGNDDDVRFRGGRVEFREID